MKMVREFSIMLKDKKDKQYEVYAIGMGGGTLSNTSFLIRDSDGTPIWIHKDDCIIVGK